MRAADVELRHGYSMADLHAIARLSVNLAGALASDWTERYETARSAIAEHLYAVEIWPQRHDLASIGRRAIYDEIRRDSHDRTGYDRANEHRFSPHFVKFWWDLVGSTPSCESRVVERTALVQILPVLTTKQRDALVALAVCDDHRAAARALGVGYSTYRAALAGGRTAFLSLWHEGQNPPKAWGWDRRAGSLAGTRREGGGRIAMQRLRERARRAKSKVVSDGR